MVWHGGISGSAPIKIAEQGHFLEEKMGVISQSETVFSSMNLTITFFLLLILPSLMYYIGKISKSEKINIYIIHKDPKTFSEYLSRINKHPNLSSIKIDKFDIPNFSFPNVEGTHVSEATYYRFFIEK